MDIILGLLIIAVGSFGQSSSYVPINKVREWSWESFWLVQGIFAWLVFPLLGALLGGAKLRDACVKAGEFVRDTIAYTAQQGTDPNFGVQFEKLLPYLWQK